MKEATAEFLMTWSDATDDEWLHASCGASYVGENENSETAEWVVICQGCTAFEAISRILASVVEGKDFLTDENRKLCDDLRQLSVSSGPEGSPDVLV